MMKRSQIQPIEKAICEAMSNSQCQFSRSKGIDCRNGTLAKTLLNTLRSHSEFPAYGNSESFGIVGISFHFKNS